jgi:pimeloyl-ACP methyl ester carboxylesterase
MGGMICQVAAIEFPKAVKSVISVASSSMNPSLPEPSLRVKLCLISSPKSNSEEDLIAAKVADYKVLFEGSPASEEYLKTFATAQIKRTRYRAGNIRQLYAVRTAKPRDAELEKVKAPFLVLHGAGDVLIPPSHAHHLASIIPNAHLALIQNMGHVMWPGVIKTILDETVDHLKRVEEPLSP